MKMRNVMGLALAMLVVFGLPAIAEDAVPENAEIAVCSATLPTVSTDEVQAEAPTAENAEAPIPLFQAVGQCNCTLGSPCSIPCPSATQVPVCVNTPCLSISALLNGVCKCV
jgi:hypothetical protein